VSHRTVLGNHWRSSGLDTELDNRQPVTASATKLRSDQSPCQPLSLHSEDILSTVSKWAGSNRFSRVWNTENSCKNFLLTACQLSLRSKLERYSAAFWNEVIESIDTKPQRLPVDTGFVLFWMRFISSPNFGSISENDLRITEFFVEPLFWRKIFSDTTFQLHLVLPPLELDSSFWNESKDDFDVLSPYFQFPNSESIGKLTNSSL
jgi:hypothetical protein